ncbi:hypothetical protein GUJ93_ZPchr0004g39753 [Zizania palustris]|uniref:Uncharacterized protein n=1 Tax=Zizania palustris TaxID=103762 RepID=A0A8J5S0F3_ZIZPA|nr:hypothetical protein GUJ93_ZPchr0004g39753 [Zizania palustris]
MASLRRGDSLIASRARGALRVKGRVTRAAMADSTAAGRSGDTQIRSPETTLHCSRSMLPQPAYHAADDNEREKERARQPAELSSEAIYCFGVSSHVNTRLLVYAQYSSYPAGLLDVHECGGCPRMISSNLQDFGLINTGDFFALSIVNAKEEQFYEDEKYACRFCRMSFHFNETTLQFALFLTQLLWQLCFY